LSKPRGGSKPPTIAALLEALQAVYTAKDKLVDFAAEREVIADALKPLLLQLSSANYQMDKPLAIGSTAIVWKVHDLNLDVERALKLPRPRFGKVSEIVRIIRSERSKLASLNHPNVVRVYFAQQVDVRVRGNDYEFPYFIMDYLEDIKDLDQYILENRQSLNAEKVITYFRDVLSGLSYLHEVGFVHCDVKPANLLIARDTPALISDLGYAKAVPRVAREDKSMTTVTYTPRYAHPTLRKRVSDSSDSDANKAEIKAADLQSAFDLFAFGRSMQDVLEALRNAEGLDPQLQARSDERSIFSPYQWQYLELVSRRLLDGQVSEGSQAWDIIPGLPPSMMEELKYHFAGEALEDIEKLLNLYDLEGEVPELNPHCASYVQVPHHKAALTPRVGRIINHPALSRLGQVTQLGFVSLVYPGALHSRLEHVLGTYASCCDYVRALWYDETNCLFRSIMRRSDLELVLVSSLLHDASQYPMAHDLTETSSAFSHERFLEGVLRASPGDEEATLAQLLKSDWELEVEDVLGVVSSSKSPSLRNRLLHSIISGPLDCDKIDYLRRDSAHLGVPYGLAVDHERFLRNLTVAYQTGTEPKQDAHGRVVNVPILSRAEIGVFEKALAAAHGLWRSRQDMFRQVYWQHTVRAFKAMLSFVVRRVLVSLDERGEQGRFWLAFNNWVFDWRSGAPEPTPPDPIDAAAQQEADLVGDSSPRPRLTPLAPSDDSLLTFLGQWTDDVGTAVLDGIRLRRPYKRVAVMSQQISGERYKTIYHQFRSLRLREDHRALEQLRDTWQRALIGALEQELQGKGVALLPGGLTPNEAIVQMRALEPCVLVDVPVKGTSTIGDSESLLYLSEDVSGVHARTSSFPLVEELHINLTQESFDREVGKIRVFVAPRWSEIFARYLNDQVILDTIAIS